MTSSALLNSSCKRGHSCGPALRGNYFNFSPIRCNVGCGIVICSLHCVEVNSSCSSAFLSWIKLNFDYFCIYRVDHMDFVLCSVDVKCYVFWFACVDHAKPNLITVCHLFDAPLDLVCQYFVENFCIFSPGILVCSFVLLCPCVVLVSGQFWPCRVSLMLWNH
jgi:hypothetical protein